MPPDLKKKPMVLQCEWQGCELIRNRMEAFLLHINEHVNSVLPEGVTAENYKNFLIVPSTDVLYCEWAECNFETTDGEVTLVRHIYFHAYHAKIKWWATQEQSKNNIDQCVLGAMTRNMIPELPEGFVCYWKDCEFFTDNAEHFYRHADNHGLIEDPVVVNGKETFPCCWEGCDAVTKTKYKLAEHLRSHTQEKRFGCKECGSLFSNRAKFIDHIARQIALELQNYQCSHCSKIFASERLLRDHMRHHVNHYKCPNCDMTCTNPSMLKTHIRWKHTTERPFKCTMCDNRSKCIVSLRKHIATHAVSNLMVCDMAGCEYKAFSFSTMKRHMLRCHSDQGKQPYICHVCGMRYSCGATLTRHLKDKHRFKWPSGHSRFRYKKQEDGLFRLQTVRYESLELTEQILKEKEQGQSESSDQDEQAEITIQRASEIVQRLEEEARLASDDGMALMPIHHGDAGVAEDAMETVEVVPQSPDSEGEQPAVPERVYLVYE